MNSSLDTTTNIISANIYNKTIIANTLGVLGEAVDGPPDKIVYPTVLDTRPKSGETDVPTNSDIYIKFSTDMDDQVLKTSIQVTSQLGIAVPGKLTYNPTEEFQAMFSPDTTLTPATSYTIRVNSSAKDVNGWRLDGNDNGKGGEVGDFYEWSFTTSVEITDDDDDDIGGDDDDDSASPFDATTTYILIAVLAIVLLGLVGFFAFLFMRDRAKDKKIDQEMKEAEGKQMVICTTCGVENEMSAKTCASCGIAIGVFKERKETPAADGGSAKGADEAGAVTATPERVLAKDIKCPSCGMAVKAGKSSCPGCGETDFSNVDGVRYDGDVVAPITEDVVCPACSKIVPAGSTQCPSCGEEDLSSAQPADGGAPGIAAGEGPNALNTGSMDALPPASNPNYTPGEPLPQGVNCPICGSDVGAGETQCSGCGEEDFSTVL
jgi:ribosomal protein L40E/RNA polymerase subunit RPABC4/transcription elongation factor Spt4